MKKTIVTSLLFGSLFLSPNLHAQIEPEDIALTNDDFQNNFFEALKQKGIENYDRAITSIQKCLTLKPNEAFLYNELGRNYLELKQTNEAYQAFEKANALDPTNRWYLRGMYDVTYEEKDFNQSIILVQKLIAFDASYKEDLASLYMATSQFDKALELINELNSTVGKSEKRDNYKKQILQNSKFQKSEKEHLEEMIAKNPKDENSYIALIFLYSESNQEEKALEIAQKLEKEIPTSDWAQVSLFKFHLNNNEGEKAVISMNKVLVSSVIDKKIKHRVINEFLIYTFNNSVFEKDLKNAVALFSEEKSINIYKEIGVFYQNKNDFSRAISYYELSLNQSPNEIETIQLLLNAYYKNEQVDKLATKAEELIELFPLEPEFYFYAGFSNNKVSKFKKAKDFLEIGLDYVIDNHLLQQKFYQQLAASYEGLGDKDKMERYLQKAKELIKQK